MDINDPPLADLITPRTKQAKKSKKTRKNKQDKVAPGSNHGFFDAENEVVFVKTTQSELEEDDNFVKVERVVPAAAVPSPDLVQSGTFNFETSSSSFGTFMNSLTGGPNKTNFVNCVFNFKS